MRIESFRIIKNGANNLYLMLIPGFSRQRQIRELSLYADFDVVSATLAEKNLAREQALRLGKIRGK